MLRDYEIVYIFDSALEEDQLEEKLEDYNGLVTGAGDGEVTAVDVWGRRKLAYPLNDRQAGNYAVVQFHADPGVLPELERACKLDDELMRHMLVLHEGEPTGPESVRAYVTEEPEEAEEDGETEAAEAEEEEEE